MPSAMEKRKEHISAVEQERSSMDRARDRERTALYTSAEARASILTTPRRLDKRYPTPLSSVTPIISSAIPHTRPVESPSSTVPITYSRPPDSLSSSDNSCSLPSASRPIATKKFFKFGDGDA
ncbi:hypothetical protein BDR04DRAFT_1102672 [Suillus decipiens]|nr:hypothetical protein BDR04DRAFT_1102672 [Suillus decipiens]